MLEEEAIKAALEGNWSKAIKLNEEILSNEKNNLEALTRLAFAFSKSNQYEKARKIYRKVLKLDPYNPIARKNLAKLKEQKKPRTLSHEPQTSLTPSLFLAEGEKIKSVNLVNIAEWKVLQTISVGEKVKVARRGFELQVKTKDGVYLGTFPDDVGRNLINLLKKKVKIQFFLQDVAENQLTVFVKSTL